MYIQHVSIPRPPGLASRQQTQVFYGGLLGMVEKPVPQSIQHLDLVWFGVGEMELHCFAEEESDNRSGRHFCLVVDDVEALREKLVTAGYKPWNPEGIPGRPRFFCRDPFGNIIEFTTIVGDYLELEHGL
ncbi:MAG: glyoxalase [Anaerolineae bacterium]|nr:glyoxalase [Anaerolineae bacterium]